MGTGLERIVLVNERHVHAFDRVTVLVNDPHVPIGTEQVRKRYEQCNYRHRKRQGSFHDAAILKGVRHITHLA